MWSCYELIPFLMISWGRLGFEQTKARNIALLISFNPWAERDWKHLCCGKAGTLFHRVKPCNVVTGNSIIISLMSRLLGSFTLIKTLLNKLSYFR